MSTIPNLELVLQGLYVKPRRDIEAEMMWSCG